MRHRIEAPSPLEDWRDAYDLEGEAREALLGWLSRANEKIPEVYLYGELLWRPPATGVFDRLQQNPPTTIKGVIRYRLTWEHAGTTTTASQAYDIEGEAPNPAEVRRVVGMAAKAVDALSEKIA